MWRAFAQAAATTAITSAGLTLGTVTQASSTTVAAGSVISETPTAGTSVAQGSAVSLIHSVLLRANRDELRPNLQHHPVPSLRVDWTPITEIESNQRELDPEVRPVLMTALHTLRSQVQRNPEIVLRYLADMGLYQGTEWWLQDMPAHRNKRLARSVFSKNLLLEMVS